MAKAKLKYDPKRREDFKSEKAFYRYVREKMIAGKHPDDQIIEVENKGQKKNRRVWMSQYLMEVHTAHVEEIADHHEICFNHPCRIVSLAFMKGQFYFITTNGEFDIKHSRRKAAKVFPEMEDLWMRTMSPDLVRDPRIVL